MADIAEASIYPLGVFDNPSYMELARTSAAAYARAAPFPNGAYDNFLPPEMARNVAASFPQPDEIAWINRSHVNNRRRYQHNEAQLPAQLRAMLREMNGARFVEFLETLTGISGLTPDPYFIGGGAHLSGQGDFLNVHTDFNWHHKLQMHRRVNALLYLTPDWRSEWKGALELWSRERKCAVASHLPIFNRLVVFSTGESSFHGQREPLECPTTVYRRVLNVYYYTARRDDGDSDVPHFTKYGDDLVATQA